MSNEIAKNLVSGHLAQGGICFVLGAADTGKTTLAAAMANDLAGRFRAAVVDADIGQSHIGPPTTVGWAIADKQQNDFSKLPVQGISFVGNVTPVGHLLQLTSAIALCVQQASKVADTILIDTPGFISGTAASALWWEVQRLIQPKVIFAVQRADEMSGILKGLQRCETQIEKIDCPLQVRTKSPEERRKFRQAGFSKYFSESRIHTIDLSAAAVQNDNVYSAVDAGRLVALRDGRGSDLANRDSH